MTKSALAEVIDTPAPTPLPPPILSTARFGQPAHYRAEHLATLPNDTPWEAIHSPQFWRLVVQRLRIGDLVEVRRDDLTRWGLYLVNFCEPSTAAINLVPILEKEFDAATFTPDATAAFYPAYMGVSDGWAVIRASDARVMAKNIRSQQDARSRIAQEFSKPAHPRFE